jgi:hypothetical protein
MALLPPARSPRWLLVFVILTVLWVAAIAVTGWLNSGVAPTFATVLPIIKVLAAANGGLALVGSLGARASFQGAQIGMLLGWLQMILTFLTTTDASSMADLGAVALFMYMAVIGLGIGVVIDLVRFFRARKQ